MITLDTLRAALFSSQPYAQLDELVRGELAVGRLTKQIRAELLTLEQPLRPALDDHEDADNALRDTIDALAGFCPAKYAYHNPPILPTEEEIAALPRWAKVAFAARCARRVLPLFARCATDLAHPSKDRAYLQYLVTQAESSASESSGSDRDALDLAVRAAGWLYAVTGGSAKQDNRPEPEYYVARVTVWTRTSGESISDLTVIIRRDFDHLARLAEWQHWTDDTPVPPEVFGPLWPEGPPPGWPADPDVPQRTDLPLELLSAARVLEQMTEDEAVNLFNAINAYYVARTGHRLTLEDLRPTLPAAVPAEV